MEVQEIPQLKTNQKKITVINFASRDCRILAIELNLLRIRLRIGVLLSDVCEPQDDRQMRDISVDPPCRDCDIYEGMDW
jgi:hypothetical protein